MNKYDLQNTSKQQQLQHKPYQQPRAIMERNLDVIENNSII